MEFDEEEEEPLPPIMVIPREVRGIIYNKLPQTQIVQLRLVCRQWKEEIDDLVDFKIEIDERNPFLERILELRVRNCKIIHFLQPPPLGIGTTILKHPNLCRILKIRTDKISPENFHYLLADTARYLKEFSTMLTLPLITYPTFSQELFYNFENLNRLSISLTTVPDGPLLGPPPRVQDNLFHKILAHQMPQLKSIKMELRCLGFGQISRFSAIILQFISKHSKSLESVDFDLIQGHGMPSSEVRPLADSDLEMIDSTMFKKVKGLKGIRVVNSTAVGIDTWAELLANQKNLSFVETDILPAPAALFRQIVLNNEKTLVSIDIGDLTIGEENAEDEEERNRPFDLSVFKNCDNLRKLTLDRNSTRRRRGAEGAELINLFSLPEFIEELAINYFLILTDEFLILFNSPLGSNLKSLTLAQCGESGDFGVDGSVLEKIVSLQNIQFVEMSPLNYDNVEERQKLNLILTTFGYNEGHSYIQLSRVTSQGRIEDQVDMSDFEP